MQLPAAHGTSLFQILSVWTGGTEAVILQHVAPAFPKSSVCELLGQKPSAYSMLHLIFPHSQLYSMETQTVSYNTWHLTLPEFCVLIEETQVLALQYKAPRFHRFPVYELRETSSQPGACGS